MKTNSAMLARQSLAQMLGVSFGGARDVYESAGYDKLISHGQYLARYLRQGIARRIVNIKPDETWRLPPAVLDVAQGSDPLVDSPFALEWNQLATGGKVVDGETRKGLLHYLHRLDRLSGVGECGVLLFGIKDGLALDQPATQGGAKGTDSLLYVNVFDGSSSSGASAYIDAYETDEASPRYGKPIYYQVRVTTGANTSATKRVHWTRILHVADEVLTNDFAGSPRLEAPWNYLLDLEKIGAATGEAAWQLMNPGLIFRNMEGYQLPVVDDRASPEEQTKQQAAIDDLYNQIDEFVHKLRRKLVLGGMQADTISGSLQDPTGSIDKLIDLVSSATGIPQRILMGAEAGQLASSQDDDNWADVIQTRQQNHVGSSILRPCIDRLIWYGILTPPQSGSYVIQWAPLTKARRQEQAQVADQNASALQKLGATVNPREFARTYLPELSPDAVGELPMMPATPGVVANAWSNYP